MALASSAISKLSVDVKDDAMLAMALEDDQVGNFSARYDNVEEWKRRHAAAIKAIEADTAFLKRWEGLERNLKVSLALLHDPDQVAGGKGLFNLDEFQVVSEPEPGAPADVVQKWNDYITQVKGRLGPQYVNQRIGGFPGKGEKPDGWPAHLNELKSYVTGNYPEAAYFIWQLSVALRYNLRPPVSSSP